MHETECTEILSRYVPRAVALGIVDWVKQSTGWTGETLGGRARQDVASEAATALRYFLKDERKRELCIAELQAALGFSQRPLPDEPEMQDRSLALQLRGEDDIVMVRAKVLEECREVGFSNIERTKLATAISELSRNVITYAGRGSVEVEVVNGSGTRHQRGLEVRIEDDGPGIPNVSEILRGRYVSKTGMGKGLRGAKQLVDEFFIDTAVGRGTRIRLRHFLK